MPPPVSREVRRLRARVAAHARHHPDRPELADSARHDLRVAAAEQYIRDLVDSWPPLTAAQRGRLATLLGGAVSPTEGGGDGGP